MSRIKKNIILIILASFFIFSCDSVRDTMGASASSLSGGQGSYRGISRSNSKSLNDFAESSNRSNALGDSSNIDTKNKKNIEVVSERKLIKEGQLEFETKDLNKTRKQILEFAQKNGAYVASDNESSNYYRKSNAITLRVPVKNFDILLNNISSGVKKFDKKIITAKDVTRQFLDTEARLKTKKEIEKRYLEILKKANSIEDILKVERVLGDLRVEIERIEGDFKYLSSKISFSTLSIVVYESIKHKAVKSSTDSGNKYIRYFKRAFKDGFESLMLFFVFLANIWPIILITILIIILLKRKKRLKKKKNDSIIPPSTKGEESKNNTNTPKTDKELL